MGAACYGHLATVQLLRLHGANRAPPNPQNWTAEDTAEHSGHAALLAWLQRTRDFTTPLHHLELLSAARTRELLRAGAALGARARPGAPSPLELARQLLLQINRQGVPASCEFRDTITPQFFADLLSWACVSSGGREERWRNWRCWLRTKCRMRVMPN